MSKDLSFKQLMSLEAYNKMPFGTFSAKLDKQRNKEKNIPNNIYFKEMLIQYINDKDIDFSDTNNKDIIKFIKDYANELNLTNSKKFQQLKNELNKINNKKENMPVKEIFSKIFEFCEDINFFDNNQYK